MEARLLTVAQLCDYLAVSRSFVYRLRCTGGIPFKRIGRQIRFDRDEIDGWLAFQQ